MTEGVTRLPVRATSTVPIVTVRGAAQLEGPPDLADFSLTVHVSADSAEHARAGLAHGSVTVAQLVKTFEDALDRSSTSGVHVTPVFNRRTPTKITGYTGRTKDERLTLTGHRWWGTDALLSTDEDVHPRELAARLPEAVMALRTGAAPAAVPDID